MVGVKRSDDVEIDTGNSVGRGLADEVGAQDSLATSRLGWNSSVAMIAYVRREGAILENASKDDVRIPEAKQ